MASRVYQVGTIVSRVNRLLETGVLKQRPVWLDVVEAFPPNEFPKHNSTPEGGRAPVIAYPEDHLKRQFYKNYTIVRQPDKCLSLFEETPAATSACSRFVSEQMQRMSMGDDETEAARRALWTLRNEGFDIRVKQTDSTPTAATSDKGGVKKANSTLTSLKGLLEQMHSRKPLTEQ